MPHATAFSTDYLSSRSRFRQAAQAIGADIEEHPIGHDGPQGQPLTLDVARIGSRDPAKATIVSSGTHGVEGYFGAAVQTMLLEDTLAHHRLRDDHGIILIHAMNPYGFAWTRRVNEENVDLNRNFLLAGHPFEGADPGYTAFNALLNPETPPTPLDPFLFHAARNIVRHGLPAMKNALAQGQYEFPKGLFFGGKRPTKSQQILGEQLRQWVGNADKVIHIDFHTGMGRWGSYMLTVSQPSEDPRTQWLQRWFGTESVEALDPKGVLYEIRGVLGAWCQQQLPNTTYHCMLAEFGTYNVLKVISALRMENRCHHWSSADSASTLTAKKRLLEAFAPSDPRWRETVVAGGLHVVHQALRAMEAPPVIKE